MTEERRVYAVLDNGGEIARVGGRVEIKFSIGEMMLNNNYEIVPAPPKTLALEGAAAEWVWLATSEAMIFAKRNASEAPNSSDGEQP